MTFIVSKEYGGRTYNTARDEFLNKFGFPMLLLGVHTKQYQKKMEESIANILK